MKAARSGPRRELRRRRTILVPGWDGGGRRGGAAVGLGGGGPSGAGAGEGGTKASFSALRRAASSASGGASRIHVVGRPSWTATSSRRSSSAVAGRLSGSGRVSLQPRVRRSFETLGISQVTGSSGGRPVSISWRITPSA